MAKKILVVDDSAMIRMLLRSGLERLGYEVVEAGNGREGLEVAQKTPDLSLIIVDINMPVMNGIELTGAIKKTVNAKLPVIVLTTEGNADYIEQAKAAGASAYLIKPFKPQHLEAIARKLAG